jgi:ATP-dependent RNA helicase DBP3
MTTDDQQAVAYFEKEQKVAKKLKKVQAKLDGCSTVSEADQAAVNKLQKKLKKLRKQVAEAQQQTGTSTTPSTQSEDSAVAVPADSSGQQKGKKSKKRAAAEATAAPEQKKSKKQKQQQLPSLNQLAVVGDAQLAATRPSVIKALYTEHPDLTAVSESKISELLQQRRTAVDGSPLRPVLTFEQTGLPASMLHATRDFVQPSPIQAQCWPIVLSGHDLIGIAATGSGKTLAFGLPMLRHIVAQREGGVVQGKGPYALVMAPTRELALQIAAVLEEAGSQCGVTCCCVYGGVPKGPQVSALRAGVDIVVGTPGRLEDLMQDGACRLQNVTYLVLDEADRMLDLGFEPHIRAISGQIRADRQTLMFSATWPTAVQQLAQNYLCSPVKVTIGSQDLAASHSVTQIVRW